MIAASANAPVRSAERTPAAPTRKPTRLWLWAPLTPLFVVLAPLALLFAPFVWLWLPAVSRPRNPFVAALTLGRVLLSLGGTVVAIDTPDTRLSIRIF